MADPRTVIEGCLKYRDYRKWKSRWCVVSKLSPVADCLHLQFYRDSKDRCKNGSTKASLSLEGFLGMETGFTLDKESNTLTLICSEVVVVLAFESRELLIQWQVKIRANLCEEQQFLVQISHAPPRSKLSCGPARLHLQDHRFCLVAGVPPRLLGVWPLKELRRFGVVDGKFCFEGGSRCGKGEGLHVLLSNQGDELTNAFDLASKGKLAPKRKNASRKSNDSEMSSRLSLQSNVPHGPHQVSSHKCSSESCRPLLSSGSEGSACDTCSEIVNMGASVGDHDTFGSVGGHCQIHYKWPSSVSSHAESCRTVSTMDDVSTAASDFQSTLLRRSMLSGAMSSHSGSQLNWFSSHSQNCCRHTLRSTASMSYKTRSRSPSPDIHLDTSGFTPQWTMDFQEVTPTATHIRVLSAPKPPKKSPADRDSLCSQSSHSSGSSSMSSNSSEYSVPKSIMESVYDHPRNIHTACRLVALSARNTLERTKTSESEKQPIPESISEGKEPRVTGKKSPEGCSSCATVGHFKCGTMQAPPTVVSKAPFCTCWNRTLVLNGRGTIPETEIPNTIPEGSVKLDPTTKAAEGLRLQAQACPCDGGHNPYAHYAVPRSVLTNVCIKQNLPDTLLRKPEEDKRAQAGLQTQPNPAEEYDVPKKIKEKIYLSDLPPVPHLRPPACLYNKTFMTLPGMNSELRCAQDNLQTCGCQKVMLWAGSLVPCWGSTDETHFVNSEITTGTNGLNVRDTVCTEPAKQKPILVTDKAKPSAPCSCDHKTLITPNPNYVNLDVTANPETQKLISPDYANLQFFQTLPLYENTSGVLARVPTSPRGALPATLPEVVDSVKPPLPPRSTGSNEVSPKRTPAVTNTTSAAYEMMSFQPSSETVISREDNYLFMQPLCSRHGGIPAPGEVVVSGGHSNQVAMEHDEAKLSQSLPLRPFMPYLLPCGKGEEHHLLSKEMRTASLGSMRSPVSGRPILVESLQQKASRSNSLEGLKRKVLMKKRSCSAENRLKGDAANDNSEPEDNGIPETVCSSPKTGNVKRKNSLFSKLSLRTKEKSYSTDEISPPSSVPSSPSNAKSFENLHRLPFHHSADCLKQKEEYVSEEDIPNSVYAAETLHPDFKYNLKIKRSCSVPCKQRDKSMSSTSDSACASDNSSSSGKVKLTDKHYLISEHFLDTMPTPDSSEIMHLAQPPLTPKRNAIDPSKPKSNNLEDRPIIKACGKHDGKEKLSMCGGGGGGNDSRNNTGSTSSSDMSDYIETLSLCSRTSSGSGSSSDYIRSEELCVLTGVGCHPNNQCANTLRPRFGKEYHSIDRNFLHENNKKTDLETEAEDHLSRELRNNLNSFVAAKPFPSKSGSPSPGYISSSPGTVDCNCSPACSNLFQFPKSTKELNYLEMEITEPASHAAKPEGVQYAVIDVLATEAAMKLSCERANSRNEPQT